MITTSGKFYRSTTQRKSIIEVKVIICLNPF
jgi:hypothetical protein